MFFKPIQLFILILTLSVVIHHIWGTSLQKWGDAHYTDYQDNSICRNSIDGGDCRQSLSKINPDLDPLDLKNGANISAIYELQRGTDLKLLFYFYYGSNSINMQRIVLNPRFYSKYIIIQSK